MVVLKDENIILAKLNELMEIEIKDFIQYCSTPICNRAKEGKEYEYNQYKKRIELLIDAKNYILFSFFFAP
ncbi:MAG: hypothetical protein FWD71_18305 [Oscillospiraceae bacterium]|nr:hypothetical protein [Oscillospiraceae bacterium]